MHYETPKCFSSLALFAFSILFISPVITLADTLLEEIIVTTGTKTERKLLDVPVRTEVISKQALQKTHARDLSEALKNVPGLLLKSIHGKSGSEVWLQGLDADRVLVLIDGRPVSASTGATVDISQIALADIDHIEIVKGAVSALYGSEAMGGVINIISHRSKKPFRYSFVVDTGSYANKNLGHHLNDKHIMADLSRHKNNWDVRLSLDVRDSKGADLDKSTWRFEGDAGTKSNLSTEVNYTFKTGLQLGIKPSFYKEDLNHNFSSFAPGIGQIKKSKREKATRSNLTLNFKQALKNNGKLSGWAMHERFNDKTEQDIISTRRLDQKRSQKLIFDKAEIQWDQPVGEKQLWTVGLVGFQGQLQQSQDKFNGNTPVHINEISSGTTRRNIEIYAQDDIFLSDTLEILPGVRYQHDSDFGSHIAPKINLMYSPEWSQQFATKLRFGLGKGYRVPTLKDRHYIFDHSALGYMVLGNPKLTPESSDSVQVGIELSKSNQFNLELNLFHNKVSDLINTELDPVASAAQNLQIFKYTNIGKAKTQGLDLSSRYTLTPKLSLKASYNYLHAKDLSSNKFLTQRPKHQAKLGLDIKIPRYKAELSLQGNYQSKEYVDSNNTRRSPAWSSIDLKFNKEIKKGSNVFLGINNLTDVHIDTPPTGEDFRPKSGRFIYAGVRFDG